MHHIEYYIFLQPVVALVKMEGHSVKQPVHVTVQAVSVGTPVEVSAVMHVTLILFGYIHIHSIYCKMVSIQLCFCSESLFNTYKDCTVYT